MKKILLIEDNKELAGNFSILLEDRGFNVIVAYTGSDGLQKVLETKPDIILCDIMLPDISGYKLLTEIKKIKNENLPIFIFITAKNQRQDFRKGMELGADDYITKPFSFQELITAINAQINKRKNLFDVLDSSVQNKREDKASSSVLDYNDYIFLDDRKSRGLYPVNSIITIKSLKDYTWLSLTEDKRFILRKSMLYWEKKLPSDKFLRVHKQTIVNIEFIGKVENISSNRLCLIIKTNEEKIEVSQRYMKKIREIIP